MLLYSAAASRCNQPLTWVFASMACCASSAERRLHTGSECRRSSQPTDLPHKQSEATRVGSERRSVLKPFPSRRPIVTTTTRVRTNPTTCNHGIRMPTLYPLSRTPIGQTYLGTEALNPPQLLIPRSRNWNP